MKRLVLVVSIVVLAVQVAYGGKWLPATVKANTGHLTDITGISFPDSLHGYAVGILNFIFYSTDGGHTLDVFDNTALPTSWFNDVYFRNNQEGWVVGSNAYARGPGVIIHTADGFRTWQEQSHPAKNNDWSTITHFGNTLWVGGGENTWPDSATGLVMKSVDDGANWQLMRLPQFGSITSIAPLSEKRIVIGGIMGTLALSTDGGQTWRQTANLDSSSWVDRIVVVNHQTLYTTVTGATYGGSGLGLFVSNDAGESWRLKSYIKRSFDGKAFAVLGDSVMLIGGEIGEEPDPNSPGFSRVIPGILKSGDGGITWQAVAETKGFPMVIYMLNSQQGWVGTVSIGRGSGGMYYHMPDETPQPTAVESTEPEARPSAFYLAQNYPNPFNPSTTIGYSMVKAGSVRLVVYDALGQVVRTLVDGRQEAGAHSVLFTAGDLPSGTYIVRLTAGEAVETKKMVLLK